MGHHYYFPLNLTPGEEDAHLSADLSDYITALTAGNNQGGYQCLKCCRVSRDLTNHSVHLLVHLAKERAHLARLLDARMAPAIIPQGGRKYPCLLCRRVLKCASYHMVQNHFMAKHMEQRK